MTNPKSFDRIAGTYDATRGGERRGKWFAADMHPLFSKSGGVFEIGIGTGVIAQALQELGRSVIGIDIGIEMARRAQERIGPRVALGNAECLPVRTESIDETYSVWLLHLVDVAAVMREVARILRPGGRYVVPHGEKREQNPVDVIEAKMLAGLGSGTKARVRLSETIVRAADEVGLRLVDRVLGAEQRYGVTPEKAAKRIEERSRSALWDVDDERWEAIVVPAIDELRALPRADERILGVTQAWIYVFER